MLQLERISNTARILLDRCFELLGKRKFPDIARELGCNLEQVVQATNGSVT